MEQCHPSALAPRDRGDAGANAGKSGSINIRHRRGGRVDRVGFSPESGHNDSRSLLARDECRKFSDGRLTLCASSSDAALTFPRTPQPPETTRNQRGSCWINDLVQRLDTALIPTSRGLALTH
jgi:hypothetical protein